MIIIGEKINGSIPSVAEAIAQERCGIYKEQSQNAGSRRSNLPGLLRIRSRSRGSRDSSLDDRLLQEVSDLPISVDSPSPAVLAEAYKFCKRPGLFNSVSGEGNKLDTDLPDYGAGRK